MGSLGVPISQPRKKPRKRSEIVASSPLVEITLLHRAMRLELEAMCEVAERLDRSSEAGEVAALERRFKDFDLVFASHSSAEDDFIFPTLASRGTSPSFPAQAAQEHEEEVALLRSVEDAIRRKVEGGAVTLAPTFRVLKEKLSEHMLQEEEVVFPLLASFPSAELANLVGLVMGSRPSEVLEATIRMEVTHLDKDHARHVLATMCDVARKTNFRSWLDAKFGNGFAKAPPARSPSSSPPAAGQCPYYGHATRIVAPCCGALVCCKRCHDAERQCPAKMDARRVTAMRCAACGADQPLAETCAYCATKVATYFCDLCKLLDSTNTPTFHCPFCMCCRRGNGLGVDYVHCMACNHCVSIEHISSHFCQADTATTCAICRRTLFASFEHVDLLPCGHPKHGDCYLQPHVACAHCAAAAAAAAAAPVDSQPSGVL
ncbi:hypothetical protein CTAYLR_001543 [Chrysophaeum taylorii]|uniref:Zinc finger protein n=1 Tax=Chrysophaeum taylorii TaxID=2483200 RepID=A0AAD7UE27_9STRA|nr:hypothetical protein CTAYLR_001543 [Chrysophaeum taylorii]